LGDEGSADAPTKARWLCLSLPAEQVAEMAMARLMDRLLPLAEKVKDLSDVAIFEKDDDRGGKYLYFSPGAAFAFAELAVEYRAQPCERPPFAGLKVFYGAEALVWKLVRNGGAAAIATDLWLATVGEWMAPKIR